MNVFVRNIVAASLMHIVSAGACFGDAEHKWNVRTDVEVIQVPQAAGLKMRPRLRDRSSITRAVTELHEMIADGGAKLVGFETLRGPAELKLESYDVTEIRYQAEFHFPSPPGGGIRSDPEPSAEWAFISAFFGVPRFDVPLAFETRNTGISIETEVRVLNIREAVNVGFSASNVVYLGDRSTLAVDKTDFRFTEPIFRSHRIVTQAFLESKVWHLVGVCVIEGEEPMMEFTLIRTTILPAAE